VKQSRFKEIIREELALSRVKLREGQSTPEYAAQCCRAALDSLTNVLHQVATLEEDVNDRSPDLGVELDASYSVIRDEMQRLDSIYKRLKTGV
jgi:hypothetical protein